MSDTKHVVEQLGAHISLIKKRLGDWFTDPVVIERTALSIVAKLLETTQLETPAQFAQALTQIPDSVDRYMADYHADRIMAGMPRLNSHGGES